MSNSKGINREYKDRLFTFIFGNSENKDWTLSLYNAVNGSAYTNPDDINLNTIDNVVYMGMKNDISFLIGNTMNLYEQQSTFNPNMPMRFLIYAGMLYSKYIDGNNGYHRFSKQQQQAPTPKCVCFYNGTDNKQDRVILSLADAFKKDSKPDIEVKVTMININYGYNKDLLNACKPLNEYAWFVDKVRNSKTNIFEEAVDMALAEMPDDFLIKPFLMANKAEVKHMCITEYDESRTLAEQREEGRIEGKAEGILNTLVTLVQKGLITITDAANTANMTVAEFEVKTGLKA
ncbi:MAG: hypothetical protein NC040_09570 [Muribaculaceae bacterium]|nr:hypothetical protein [Alistipes senegalensis]MCM1474298.1 hypothetical protein [Muribaculaceae bacterium]